MMMLRNNNGVIMFRDEAGDAFHLATLLVIEDLVERGILREVPPIDKNGRPMPKPWKKWEEVTPEVETMHEASGYDA